LKTNLNLMESNSIQSTANILDLSICVDLTLLTIFNLSYRHSTDIPPNNRMQSSGDWA